MIRPTLRAIFMAAATLGAAGCGGTPDGSCYTDFDCEPDQVCGLEGYCLLCENCQRGVVATCTAPAWPLDRIPDSIRIESYPDREKLIYVYDCDGPTTEYRYHRVTGERCFESTPHVADDCGFED